MHIKFNILLFFTSYSSRLRLFLVILSNCWGFFLVFGLNDIFKYIEKHQQSQRQDWADTLSEIVLEGKERTRIEKLEDLLSQNPPLPEAVSNQLLCLHEQGFLLPRRYESNFFKMYYHREKLKHLRQTYEKENSVFFEKSISETWLLASNHIKLGNSY